MHVRLIARRALLNDPGAGIEVVLKGDPNQAGVYAILLRVPPHTPIPAHSHRDDRVATVISGMWRFGYGLWAVIDRVC